MLALAALSARALAEAAAREGLACVALDVFGDADTQNLALEWHDIGTAGELRIDADRLLAVLQQLARRGDVRGWIAGSGFDGRTELLEQAAARLPLIGTAAVDVRRVRDPREFFRLLDRHGIGFPSIAFEPPPDPAGWLRKDAGGCGGWHIRRARTEDRIEPGLYWQRERRGAALSATFVANGRDGVLLGVNRQGTRPIGDRPYVFTRIVGPVGVSERVRRELVAIVRLLAGAFHVRGLASLDFLLDGDRIEVLELNPRPPASLALYPQLGDGGVLAAHLHACEHDTLPLPPPAGVPVRGLEILFAARPHTFDAARAGALAALPGTCDRPRAGTRVATGDPLCSVVAEGADEARMNERLDARRLAVHALLETCP